MSEIVYKAGHLSYDKGTQAYSIDVLEEIDDEDYIVVTIQFNYSAGKLGSVWLYNLRCDLEEVDALLAFVRVLTQKCSKFLEELSK